MTPAPAELLSQVLSGEDRGVGCSPLKSIETWRYLYLETFLEGVFSNQYTLTRFNEFAPDALLTDSWGKNVDGYVVPTDTTKGVSLLTPLINDYNNVTRSKFGTALRAFGVVRVQVPNHQIRFIDIDTEHRTDGVIRQYGDQGIVTVLFNSYNTTEFITSNRAVLVTALPGDVLAKGFKNIIIKTEGLTSYFGSIGKESPSAFKLTEFPGEANSYIIYDISKENLEEESKTADKVFVYLFQEVKDINALGESKKQGS